MTNGLFYDTVAAFQCTRAEFFIVMVLCAVHAAALVSKTSSHVQHARATGYPTAAVCCHIALSGKASVFYSATFFCVSNSNFLIQNFSSFTASASVYLSLFIPVTLAFVFSSSTGNADFCTPFINTMCRLRSGYSATLQYFEALQCNLEIAQSTLCMKVG